jgi:transcriptional regulator with XRE-family HTH domain
MRNASFRRGELVRFSASRSRSITFIHWKYSESGTNTRKKIYFIGNIQYRNVSVSQFSSQLQASMEADRLTQQAILDKIDISQGALSRYCNGSRPVADQLEKLLGVFSSGQRVALLTAYLEDEIPGKYRGLVVIEPAAGGDRIKEPAPVYRSRMPRDLREAWEGLGRKALEHPEVADSLIATWRVIGPRDEKA